MLPRLISDRAHHTPNRIALIYNDQPLSYGAFARHIAEARGYFSRRGYYGAGYAILAVNCLLDFWIISLALRSLGLTTVAVPAVSSVATLADKLGLADVRCVVTSSIETWPGLEEACAGLALRLLPVSLKGEPALELDASKGQYPAGGHILLTSGTTGSYKMVLMTPAVDAVFLQRKVEMMGMSQDTVLCVFDFAAWTAVGYRWAASPWTVGGAVVIEQGREPHRALLRTDITHAVLVPSRLASVLAAPGGAFQRNDKIQLTVGGGAMSRSQVEQTRLRITSRLYNFLASTEAGGITHTRLNEPDDLRWHQLAAGRVVEVVDELDHPSPPGGIGRVRISTGGGPDSYLNDAVATETFFRHGYFYPGDLAAFRADGRMALHGRVTDVINIRGQKVYPALIEERLCELLEVSGACLFSGQNDDGEEEIHVVLESTTPLDPERLSGAIRQELAGFPRARIYYLAELARNNMGKIVRQQVRNQTLAHRPSSSGTGEAKS